MWNLCCIRGVFVNSVVIETDGKQEVYEKITPPNISNTKDFIKAIRDSGLVGLGGAGFPAHVKLSVPPGKNRHFNNQCG